MPVTTLYDKEISRTILLLPGVSFYGILLAAIDRADTYNLQKLEMMFPEAVRDARIRYNAPDGCVSVQEWLHKNPDENVDKDLLETLFAEAQAKARKR